MSFLKTYIPVQRSSQNGFTAIILAAGLGVRMMSERPKVLHNVCGQPMLAHVIRAVRDAGAKKIVVVVRPEDVNSPEFLSITGPEVHMAVQENHLGTAHALAESRDFVGDDKRVIVGLGDMPLITHDTVQLLNKAATPNSAMTLLTTTGISNNGLGRIVRDENGAITRIVEEADAGDDLLALEEVNSGWYKFEAEWLWNALPRVKPSTNGELYLTDLAARASSEQLIDAVSAPNPEEILGVNDRIQLSNAENIMRNRIRLRWMRNGVTLVDPSTTYIDTRVQLSKDVVIKPNTHLVGRSQIGPRCEIGPNSIISDSKIGEDSNVECSHTDSVKIGARVKVGPFSRLRPGTELSDNVFIGNFAEIKKSRIGNGSRIGHHSYIGDASLGTRVNIGAGTITCNFDGTSKHKTVIGDEVQIGSGTMLVAPIKIGNRARTGAGTVVLANIPEGTTVVGVPARILDKDDASQQSTP